MLRISSLEVPAVAANIQDEKFSRFPRTKPINIPTNASTDDTTLQNTAFQNTINIEYSEYTIQLSRIQYKQNTAFQNTINIEYSKYRIQLSRIQKK